MALSASYTPDAKDHNPTQPSFGRYFQYCCRTATHVIRRLNRARILRIYKKTKKPYSHKVCYTALILF